MISYLDQLKAKANLHGVFLYRAFEVSGVTQSTYSRTIRGRTHLHLATAIQISNAIEKLSAELKEKDLARGKKPRKSSRLRIVRETP